MVRVDVIELNKATRADPPIFIKSKRRVDIGISNRNREDSKDL